MMRELGHTCFQLYHQFLSLNKGLTHEWEARVGYDSQRVNETGTKVVVESWSRLSKVTVSWNRVERSST